MSVGVRRLLGGEINVHCVGVRLVDHVLYGKAQDAKACVMFVRAFRAYLFPFYAATARTELGFLLV